MTCRPTSAAPAPPAQAATRPIVTPTRVGSVRLVARCRVASAMAGAELAVACVAEAGQDVAAVVELRSRAAQWMATSGCASLTALTPSGAAMRLTSLIGVAPHSLSTSMAAVAEPPVASIGSRMRQVRRSWVGQLVVVLDGAERPLVPEQAQVPDLGGGEELEEGIHHAEAGPKDGHQADALGQLVADRRLERRLHGDLVDPGIGQGLVADQPA